MKASLFSKYTLETLINIKIIHQILKMQKKHSNTLFCISFVHKIC
jgi:hypothetical protein